MLLTTEARAAVISDLSKAPARLFKLGELFKLAEMSALRIGFDDEFLTEMHHRFIREFGPVR